MSFRFNQGDRPLEGYTIQRGVGRGGFGEVYYALSDGGKEVALKYLRENPTIELRGVQHCLNLKSPHLVSIFDVKQNDAGEWFVVMEYVAGPSLRDLLNESPAGLGPAKAAYFFREMARGLAYLHDRGIVHRDLKPGNVFYDEGYVKIGDYGLSKFISASQHSGQTISVGTVHYMAPEIGSGHYDRTIDIYALGVMLYELVTGRVPHSGATVGEILMKHLTAEPAVADLPAPFGEVVRRALCKDPKERFQTVPEMMAALFTADLDKSVAELEPISLSMAAERMAARVRASVPVGGGSSNRPAFPAAARSGPTPRPPAGGPPPIPRSGLEARGLDGQPFAMLVDQIEGRRKGPPSFPQRSRWIAGLLGLFLGQFGVHRFYLGYNRVGVIQILVTCFTGVGALWGIVEGIMILANGDMVDAYGRPLLARDPAARSVVIRLFFGLLGFAALLAAVGTAIGGTFASETETRATLSGAEIAFNPFRFLYLASAGLIGLGSFSIWKAFHRPGYGFWRATLRPALMTGLAALGLASVASFFALAHGIEHRVATGLAIGAAAGFALLWQLRGPESSLLPSDLYWDGALKRVFALLGVGLFVAIALVGRYRDPLMSGDPSDVRVIRSWASDELAAARAEAELKNLEVYVSKPLRLRTRPANEPVAEAGNRFSAQPMLAPILGLLGLSCLFEARYRRRRLKLVQSRFPMSEFAA